jgi:uncharacterized Rmd1/YagE family protein
VYLYKDIKKLLFFYTFGVLHFWGFTLLGFYTFGVLHFWGFTLLENVTKTDSTAVLVKLEDKKHECTAVLVMLDDKL